ncbi:MAG: polysaccharide deacetylase family protein [Alistipes sp.]|nr:polysaccharide deacetylase family protein [Alistipes sp.]
MSCLDIILLVALAIFVVVNIFMVWASADVGSNIYVKAHCKGTNRDRCVALTFDDGPNAENTAKVLDVLKRHNIRATFFLIGKNVKENPALASRIVDEGHIVANHTYSHDAMFPMGNKQKIEHDIVACSEAIYSATGCRPRLFRPPFGVTTPNIGKASRELRQEVIGWSIRSYDTMSRPTRESVVKGVMKKIHPGAIILLHDRCDGAEVLLERLITECTQQGYRFVALDETLNIKVYEG